MKAKLTLKFIFVFSLAFGAHFMASAQSEYSANPTYKKDKPQFTAQNHDGEFVIYDSYWTKDQWKIHCSKKEFCYMHFKLKRGEAYNGSEVGDKLIFDPSKRTEHSFALGVKSGTRRTYFSIPFFKREGRVYTSRWQDYEGKDRPSGEITYWIDNKILLSRPYKKRIPMFFSMYTDWEPDTVDDMDTLIGTLYHTEAKELSVAVYFGDTAVVGVVLDVTGFKAAYDEMLKERNAREELAKNDKIEFINWPSSE